MTEEPAREMHIRLLIKKGAKTPSVLMFPPFYQLVLMLEGEKKNSDICLLLLSVLILLPQSSLLSNKHFGQALIEFNLLQTLKETRSCVFILVLNMLKF